MLTKISGKRRNLLIATIAVLSLPLFPSPAPSLETELSQVEQGIRDKAAQWIAAETSISQLPQGQRLKRLGLKKSVVRPSESALPAVSSEMPATLPSSLDYRVYDYVTPVKDQGDCSACWAFATVAALESQILMSTSTVTDEAEQILLSCSGAGDCDGGRLDLASIYIQSPGLPPEQFFPYTQGLDDCSKAVSNWQNNTSIISSWGWVTRTSPTVGTLKNALFNNGPLVTTMNVYTDFFYYAGGVYSQVSGDYEGEHAVEIIGYDDASQCFIAKNSWGTDWGDAGFFRIAYSQLTSVVQFGDDTITYGDANVQTGSLTVTIEPQQVADAGGRWRVDGDAWQNSGVTVYGIVVGPHTVDFRGIAGWNTPAAQTAIISKGQTTSVGGTYVPQTGSLTVAITPQGAIEAGAQWNVDGGAWQNSGRAVSDIMVGPHAVDFKGIAGWNTPAGQTVTISNGQTTSVNGTYVPQTGSLTVAITPEGAIEAGAQWNVDGGAWQNSGRAVSDITAGPHTVGFKDIPGWVKAAGQTVQITSGQTTSLGGQYQQLPTVTSFQIEGGGAKTSSRSVTLANSVSGNPAYYMASEVLDFSGATWQTYSNAPSFTLSVGGGIKTVYFKVKNSVGESPVVSGTIELVAPPAVVSFLINGGAETTSSRTVAMNNSATEPPASYLASEAPSFRGAVWKPYSEAPVFTLSAGNGTKTVYLKVRNASGTSLSVSDSIDLAELPAVTSFKINRGTASTISQTVTLNNKATLLPTQYMASEFPDFTEAARQPYSTAPRFTLSAGSGTKTIYFKVNNDAGESLGVQDTIELIVRPEIESFQIDNGADSTSSRVVTLNNSATESPTHYMASQSPRFSGAVWKRYSSAPSFKLSAARGAKTVYFKVKNAAGVSSAVSAAIILVRK
jgi:C1A family cysteine protease